MLKSRDPPCLEDGHGPRPLHVPLPVAEGDNAGDAIQVVLLVPHELQRDHPRSAHANKHESGEEKRVLICRLLAEPASDLGVDGVPICAA